MKPGYFFVGLMLLVFISPAEAQVGCDRACLEGHVSTFLDALYANTPNVVPLEERAKISDNNRLVSLREAFWDDAADTAYRWDIANPRLGDVATEVVKGLSGRLSEKTFTYAYRL